MEMRQSCLHSAFDRGVLLLEMSLEAKNKFRFSKII